MLLVKSIKAATEGPDDVTLIMPKPTIRRTLTQLGPPHNVTAPYVTSYY